MERFFKFIAGQKKEVNYLYFGAFFIFLSALSLFVSDAPLFFLVYGIGQAFLEVCLLVLATHLIQRWAPKWLFYTFVSLSFLLALLHFTQFTMVRVMDTSVLYIIRFFFLSGFDHLIAGLQALNMNWTMILTMVAAIVTIPILGLGFYYLTQKIARYKILTLSLAQISAAAIVTAGALFMLDVAHLSLSKDASHGKYQKILPLGSTFLSPASSLLHLKRSLMAPRNEEKAIQSIPNLKVGHLPNLYFFVIETFRKDFLDAAPHLTAFAKEHISFDESFSNANSTHLSWFSLFHSTLPFHWTTMRDTWEKGSIPLQYLKKLGYKTHVYSSADLHYFGMDKLLFGRGMELVDQLEEYTTNRGIEPCDRDALAIRAIEKNLERNGHAYFIFLDSTHSEYSFPKDFPLQYEPVAKEIDYLTISAKSPELELIKNRYRNSIRYVDHLMGSFFALLKRENLFEDAIIAITGDHGEEFFEEGALFHGTHLNRYQTSVPIFLKLPSKEWVSQTKEATHIDLFPSILHYLTKQSDFSSAMDGRSIFNFERAPLRVAVLHNGSEKPREFSIYKENFSLQAKIVDDLNLEVVEMKGSLEANTLDPLLKKAL